MSNPLEVMSAATFCTLADEFSALRLAEQARRDLITWRGVKVEMRGGLYSVPHAWAVKNELKAAGFKWNNQHRTWETDSSIVVGRCPQLVRKARGPARESLKDVTRIQAAGDTFERARSRLATGDVERVREALTPEIATAIRAGIALLSAADDDKAAIRNNRGWSKAHTELGHTLRLTGIKTFLQAAIALKLLWSYRGQLPEDVVSAAFPVHASEQPEITVAEPTALTLTQAQELVSFPVDVTILTDLAAMPCAVLGASTVADDAAPAFIRVGRRVVARIEGGAVLVLVTRGNKLVRLEIQ